VISGTPEDKFSDIGGFESSFGKGNVRSSVLRVFGHNRSINLIIFVGVMGITIENSPTSFIHILFTKHFERVSFGFNPFNISFSWSSPFHDIHTTFGGDSFQHTKLRVFGRGWDNDGVGNFIGFDTFFSALGNFINLDMVSNFVETSIIGNSNNFRNNRLLGGIFQNKENMVTTIDTMQMFTLSSSFLRGFKEILVTISHNTDFEIRVDTKSIRVLEEFSKSTFRSLFEKSLFS